MGITTRIAGSIVVGRILAAALGLGVSHIFHERGADSVRSSLSQ